MQHRIRYNKDVRKREELITMASWYTVERGFITCDIYFDTEDDAELYCIAMCAVTGDMWGEDPTCYLTDEEIAEEGVRDEDA